MMACLAHQNESIGPMQRSFVFTAIPEVAALFSVKSKREDMLRQQDRMIDSILPSGN
jgi:hypothetical protein